MNLAGVRHLAETTTRTWPSLLLGTRRFVESKRRVALLVAGLAVVVRTFVFAELATGPLASMHRWSESDMSHFDSWAQAIAAGDALSRDVGAPIHAWHRWIAEEYLRENPSDAQALAATGDAVRSLWARWTGGPSRFYQDPLYPYLVAVTYAFAGPDPRAVFAWQMALGVATALLVLSLSRRIFGAAAGAVAGVMAALYAPLAFLEFLLLRDCLIAFASLGITWLLVRARESGRPGAWLVFGLAGGVAFLLKGTLLFLVAGLGVGALVASRRARAPRSVAAAALGLALGVAPLVARNVAVGVAPLSPASSGTLTFVEANAVDYPARQGGIAHGRHAARILGEAGGRFLPAALATLGTHPDAISYLDQLGQKLSTSLRAFEIPNNESFDYALLHSTTLRRLPLTFLLVSPLGLLGLILSARGAKGCWPMYVLVAASMLPLLAFMSMSRLRLPLAVALIPFAGLALAEIGGWLLHRRPGDVARAGTAIAAAIVLASWTGFDPTPPARRIPPAHYLSPLEYHYLPRTRSAIAAGDWTGAAAILEAFVRTEPAELQFLSPERPARDPWEARLASGFGWARGALAEALENAGDPAAAHAQRREAARLAGAAR